ncbi:MAG: DUF4369 domain-containing protein [Bacteroidaceae bacterium]|nr:DUF4369 domain-containing protein [Bacteroidaceae bacterium]
MGRFLFPFLILVLAGCNDPYSFRIKGEISNLQQADFLVYSLDGSMQHIDTIHVKEGSFSWSTPLSEEAIFYIVFPNQSELTVFGQPGKTARLKGDANELRAIEVTGTDDNEAYTEFRLACLNYSDRQQQEAMKQYIQQYPESHVSIHMQHLLRLQNTGLSNLKIGKKLPKIVLPPDGISGTDTLTLKAGQPVVLIFWASWRRESKYNFFDIQRIKRQVADLPLHRKLRPISISLDLNPDDYASTCRYDSVTWESRCYRQSWSTPIVEQFGIRELPYYVLANDSLEIVALGTDWRNDIQRQVFELIHP